MAVHSKTQAELRQSIAYGLDDCVVGTCEAGSSNTLAVCSYLLRGDKHYNGWDFHVYGGVNVGLTREITDGWNANTTIQVAPALTSALTTNSTFELHKMFTTTQYNDAINRAIEAAKDEYLLDKYDDTTTLVTDTFEYNIPSGFRFINALYVEDKTDADKYYDSGYIDDRHWTILHGSTNKLRFYDTHPIGTDTNGQSLRIVGQTIQSILSNDADTCKMPPEFIIWQARAILLANKGKDTEADKAQRIADRERRMMRVPLYAFAKAVDET